jgi:osmotically-inducible protein OsmY
VLLAVGTLFSTAILTHATDTDSRIETAAKSSYVFKTYLKDDSIQTKSKNGMVVLTGSVTEASHKALAENAVENLPGVVSVKNQLRVKGQSSTMHSDLELAAKVKTALRFHRHVSADKTEVAVKDSVVTLTGEADSIAQKDLTSEYAKDIDGVKSVKNDMTIAKSEAAAPTMGEKIDDASTTAQVKFSLLSHRSTSALKTSVKTTDGVVTISGIAKNDTEKALVAKLVSDINGVVSVVNNMTIAAPVAAR